MLRLKKATGTEHGSTVVLEYGVYHQTPGRDGTVLSADLKLSVDPAQTSCTISIDPCEAASPDEALARMATWLRRLADGIEDRKSLNIPI